jgi:Asp-tRNA(Asn)/Glu-tRNA(Gln) amidotransferase A subunit family amidase
LRIGYFTEDHYCESTPPCKNVVNEVIAKLREEGHEIIHIDKCWTERFLLTGIPIM